MRSRAVSSVVAALVAAGLLVLAGCSDGPRSEGGYIGADPTITIVPPAERKPAPVVSGDSLDGEGTVSTADYAGKIIVINVWGSWCPPCREEAPALQEASEQTKDRAAFVGITTKDFDPAPARAFVRANKITYPSIYDPTGSTLLAFAGTLPPSAIPSTLIIDADGRVAARILDTVTTTTLVDIVDDVAAGR